MQNSKIQWTHNTFNPWWGCEKISPACANCYAAKLAGNGFFAHEYAGKLWGKNALRKTNFASNHWLDPVTWNRRAERTGVREQVFCGSMCDIMEANDQVTDARLRTFKLIEETPHLDWLLLTKRPQNFTKFLPAEWLKNPRPNVWLMTTCESQGQTWRIHELIEVPAVVHGVSIEPMLGPVQLPDAFLALKRSAWVICGSESGGTEIRPTPIEWFRAIRDTCILAGVPFFFKQWGNWDHVNLVRLASKEDAGRTLDGRTWDEYPAPSIRL